LEFKLKTVEVVKMLKLTALSILAQALAVSALQKRQNLTQSIAPTTTLSNGTALANPTAFASTLNLNVEDLWDLFVGPITEASTTATVSATPVPSSSLIPPPPIYYSPFPAGQQEPYQAKNESWSFPKDFWWGVAGAAFQVEGAVKDEGRGPSIWDVLGHRVTNYEAGNYTADVTDNHYYLYKEGMISQILLLARAS
jgi:hypothetical protein